MEIIKHLNVFLNITGVSSDSRYWSIISSSGYEADIARRIKTHVTSINICCLIEFTIIPADADRPILMLLHRYREQCKCTDVVRCLGKSAFNLPHLSLFFIFPGSFERKIRYFSILRLIEINITNGWKKITLKRFFFYVFIYLKISFNAMTTDDSNIRVPIIIYKNFSINDIPCAWKNFNSIVKIYIQLSLQVHFDRSLSIVL